MSDRQTDGLQELLELLFAAKNSPYLGSKLIEIYTEMLEDQTEPVEVDVEEVVVLLHHPVPVPGGEVPGRGEDEVGEVGDGAESCWGLEVEEGGLELTLSRGSELERALPERAVTHGEQPAGRDQNITSVTL